MQNTALTDKVKQAPAIQPLLYNKRTAATLLSLSLRTIDNLIVRKLLTPIRIGGRVLIRANEIQQFIKRDHPLERVT